MIKKFIPYDPKLKERARNLRLNSTLAEVLLWKYLRGKQLGGYKFHRQKPLFHYIVDFFCSELMLAKGHMEGVWEVINDWIKQHKE